MSTTFTLSNVPIFAVGRWNNDDYNEADLDRMVAAYGVVGFKPPVKLGHDESQPLAKSDSMPALGWVANLRRVGTQLFADIKGLPAKVYEAIRRKNYDRVSAEVYWDYEEGGKKLPRVLKALALLGAEIPAVTSLAALEALYDASGKPFRRYDLSMPPLALVPTDTLQGMAGEMECQKKAKADVNWRTGGADDDGDGLPDRCGSCQYFQGTPDVAGTAYSVGQCALVDGDVGSTMLCDLYDAMDAFSPMGDVAEMSNLNHMPAGSPEGGQFAPGGGGGGGSKSADSSEKGKQGAAARIAAPDMKKVVANVSDMLNSGMADVIKESDLENDLHDHKALTTLVKWAKGGKVSPADAKTATAGLADMLSSGFVDTLQASDEENGTKDLKSLRGLLRWAKSQKFSEEADVKTYIIQKRGDKWVLISKTDGKVLGEHPTEEAAKKQEAAIEISKHAHAEGQSAVADTSPGSKTFTLPIEAVKALCPGCADRMAFLNLKELKLSYDPATKTYAGFSQGLCDRFGDATGFRTRCMADTGKLSESVGDLGAFCNSLKEYCFGSVTAGGSKHAEQTPVKKISTSDAKGGRRYAMGMTIKEQNGQHCVMDDSDDSVIKCFPSRGEAEAYMASENGETPGNTTLTQAQAEIKALTEKLEAAGRQNEVLAGQVTTLSAKVPELEKYVSESEAEKVALRETARKAANEQWVKSLTAEGSVRLLPVEVPVVSHLLDWMTSPNGEGLKTYALADGKEQSNVEAFKSVFEQRQPMTALFSEMSKGTATEQGGAPAVVETATSMTAARDRATALAKAYMKEKNEKSFKAALTAVYKANPDLHRVAAGVTEQGEAKAEAGAAGMARMFKK